MGDSPHTLYRMYDSADRLLYVGISMTIAVRLKTHRSEKPWWTDVAVIRTQHFESRADARAAELDAIIGEGPLYNIADKPPQYHEEDGLDAEEVADHYASHPESGWCDLCEGWPHTPIPAEDGWCTRCDVHCDDHEWDAHEMTLVPLAPNGPPPEDWEPTVRLPQRPSVAAWKGRQAKGDHDAASD